MREIRLKVEGGIWMAEFLQDAAEAAALLDYAGAPELTEDQFEELTEAMRQVREEVPPDDGDGSVKGSA